MKRALLPLVAAVVLTVSACGGDSGDGSGSSSAPAPSSSSSSSASSSSSSASGTPTAASAASTNEQAREACQNGVVEQLPGATFAEPGTLRVASSAEGKQYTVTGSAQVAGAAHTYTCGVVAATGTVEVTDVTVG